MSVDVAVVVATYGEIDVWEPLAERAVESAVQQSVEPRQVVWEHADTLAAARNIGAGRTTARWLIFLDADDELAVGYIAAMESAAATTTDQTLHQPRTLGVYEDGHEDDAPAFIQPGAGSAPLLKRNHLVIGTMVSRRMFEQAGGFEEYPVAEDWAFWLACWTQGATWVQVPDAIYRVGVRAGSRNMMPARNQAPVISTIRSRYTALARQRGLL